VDKDRARTLAISLLQVGVQHPYEIGQIGRFVSRRTQNL
jgi:hypothetical protein